VVGITFLYRSVPDQLDLYPIATRPYISGLGREQVAYKSDQAVVELGREFGRSGRSSSSDRQWERILNDTSYSKRV